MKTSLPLMNFLNLSIDHATDAYLRELALVAIQSRHLAHTVEQLSVYQRSLIDVAEASKGELIEGRYLVSSDGTVTDQKSKLMWMQAPLDGRFTFEVAQQAAENLNAKNGFAGHADWRVPTQDELLSLVVSDKSPCICQEAFPDTPIWFWTSSTATNSQVWTISFGSGRAMPIGKLNFIHVRLVRD
jgi:hypothetical protein